MSLHRRLIAIDADGTLLGSDHQVSARTRRAISAAVEAGATVVLATGRDWRMVTGILDAVPEISHAVCINGIEVFDRDGQELFAGELAPDLALAAVRAIRAAIPEAAFAAGVDGDFIGEPALINAMPPGVAQLVAVDDIEGSIGPGLRDIVVHGPGWHLEDLFDQIRSVIGDGIECAYTGLPMVELVPPGAGKHQGLGWLAEHLGLEASDAVVFGDGHNDLTMFEWAGTAVAMAQAHPEVRAAADEITGTNDGDGVALWLEAALS